MTMHGIFHVKSVNVKIPALYTYIKAAILQVLCVKRA